jgi:hypothetical protein
MWCTIDGKNTDEKYQIAGLYNDSRFVHSGDSISGSIILVVLIGEYHSDFDSQGGGVQGSDQLGLKISLV